jgi:hypothetical protein
MDLGQTQLGEPSGLVAALVQVDDDRDAALREALQFIRPPRILTN